MFNATPPISRFTLKKAALLKRIGIYNTPVFIPVFFQARSGSTVLGETLSTHAHCQSLNEAFVNYLNKQLPLDYTHFLKPPTEQYVYRHALKGKYLTHTFLQFNEWYYPIYNKTALEYDAIYNFIGQHFPGMVFIYRRNQLKRIVSNLRSKQHGFWHEKNNKPTSDSHKQLYLDVNQTFGGKLVYADGLLNYLSLMTNNLNDKLQSARTHNSNILELVYEDDIEHDVMIGVNKVLDHFKVPTSYKPLSVPLVKTSRGLQHDLENFDEVKAYLANTPYEWMLND